MRDSGETKRFRVRRSWFFFFVSIMFCLPVLLGLTIWGAYYLWEQKAIIEQRLFVVEKLNQEYSAQAKRLTTFEGLLKYEAEMEDLIAQNAAKSAVPPQKATQKEASEQQAEATTQEQAAATAVQTTPAVGDKQDNPSAAQTTSTGPTSAATTQEEQKPTESPQNKDKTTAQTISAEQAAMQDGPGHEEFPVIDEGIIMVENVQSRLVEPRRIRTALDLRNPGSTSLAGTVFCILSLASGEMVPLTLSPAAVGNYRILRWKKAVLFADIASEHDLFNAQMIIEVKDTAGKLLYRNSYAIEQ